MADRDTRALLARIFLALFVVSGTVGGFCISIAGGFVALAIVSFAVAYLLGAS